MTKYTQYVQDFEIPPGRDFEGYLVNLLNPKSYVNSSGEFLLTVEDLFGMAPHAALILYFFALISGARFRQQEVHLALKEAFGVVIDPMNGGLTDKGFARYAYYHPAVGCAAASHQSWLLYEKAKNDPVARIALPKATIADLGDRREFLTRLNS